MNNSVEPSIKILLRAVLVLAIIAVAAIFIIGRDFFYPVFLAVLFSYLLYPLAKFLQRWVKHGGVAILLSILIALVVFCGAFFSFISKPPVL